MTCGGSYAEAPVSGKEYSADRRCMVMVTIVGTSYEFERTNKKYRMGGLKEPSSNSSTCECFCIIWRKEKLEQLDLLELRCRSSLLNLK